MALRESYNLNLWSETPVCAGPPGPAVSVEGGNAVTIRRSFVLTAYFLASTAAAQTASPKTPTFFARRDYGVFSSTSIQVADTNGDGIPDLISNYYGSIVVLFGNGDGTFRYGPISNVACCTSLAVSGLNGDGSVDLFFSFSGAGTNGLAVSRGNGDGTFPQPTIYPVNDGMSGFLALGDFNGDGIPDAVATGAMGVWLFTGKGDGTFNPGVLAAALPPGPFEIAAADFNGDNKLDLVVTLRPGGVRGFGAGSVVLLGNGDGTFQAAQTLSMPQNPSGLAAGSLARAGPAGIAIADEDSANVYLYYGNRAGGFSQAPPVNLPGANLGGLAIGDVNGDGVPDLVSSQAYVAYGKGDGHFSQPRSYTVNTAYGEANVLLADLRNNGQTDIVTSGYYAISVLLNEGKGRLEDGIWTAVTGGATCGVSADFNGDGKPDIAVNNSQGVTILLGTGNAAKPFTPGTTIALANAGCPVTGDLNGDGKPDLLVPANGTVVAYLGNGDGTFSLASTTAAPSGGFLALGDFNHDGKLDFATSGNLLALGNGDGTFQTPTDIVANPPSAGFSGIAAGDINNDGWTDLVLTIGNGLYGDTVFVLLNNREAGFTQVPANFGEDTIQPILVDLDGDGNLDLVLQPTRFGGAEIHLGNGMGGFSAGQGLTGLEFVPGFNFVADLNGDGIPDIGVLQGDTLEIYFGKGAAAYSSRFYIGTGPSPGGLFVANLHGQPPGKGLPDIVVPDTSGGVMVLLNLTK